MSHTYYIRADQEHSNATQAQICPHRLGRGGIGGDMPGDTSWNLQNNLAPLLRGSVFHISPKDYVIITVTNIITDVVIT